MVEKTLNNAPKGNSNICGEQQKLIELSNIYVRALHRSTELHIAACTAMRQWTDMRLGAVLGKAEESVHLYDIKNKFLDLKAR